jgi:type II secretory pathway predicted ATPase ExeA
MESLELTLDTAPRVSLSRPTTVRFRSLACERAEQQVMAALGRRVRLVLVTGRRGIGKTTFARAIVEHMAPRRAAFVAANGLVSVQHLLETMLSGFGMMSNEEPFRPEAPVDPDLVAARCDFLASLALQTSAVIVVDDAERLTPEMIQALRDLMEPKAPSDTPRGASRLQLVLVGEPELPEFLRRSGLRPLGPEASARVTLGGLESTEVGPYVRQRLATADQPGADFDDDVAFRMADVSSGVPATINALWDRVVVEARCLSPNVPGRIDLASVEAAAEALELIPPRPPVRRRWKAVLTTFLVLLLLAAGAAAAYVYQHEISRFLNGY